MSRFDILSIVGLYYTYNPALVSAKIQESAMTATPELSLLPLRTIKTACPHDCPDTCSMLAHVQTDADGTARLVGVSGNPDNAYTRGNLCRKVSHYEERVYSPDRVLTPLRRVGPKGAGQFAPMSWDEALREITDRWKQIIAEDGPKLYSRTATRGRWAWSA